MDSGHELLVELKHPSPSDRDVEAGFILEPGSLASQAAAGVKFSIAEALDRFQITAEQRDCLAKRCAALQVSPGDHLLMPLGIEPRASDHACLHADVRATVGASDLRVWRTQGLADPLTPA